MATPDFWDSRNTEERFAGDAVVSYYLAAEYRRAILWATGGVIVVPVVGLLLAQKRVDPASFVVGSILLAAGPIWFLQYLAPRLCVDRQGIWRRCLWWWDLWPWQAFETGKIRFGSSTLGLSYENPEKPALFRTLSLELLEVSERKRLNDLIRKVWTPPPPLPAPESAKLQFHWPRQGSIEMSAEKMTIDTPERSADLRWPEVRQVEIWRREHGRHDFTELVLYLPDEKVKIPRAQFHGASAEDVAGILCRHLEQDRRKDFALIGPAMSLQEIDVRLQLADRRQRELKSLRWILVAGILAMLVIVGFMGVIKGTVMVLMYIPIGYAIYWMYCDQVAQAQKVCDELRTERRLFE